MNTLKKTILLLSLCIFMAGAALSSVNKTMTLKQLCKTSTEIVIGQVVSVECFYLDDDIYTSIKIKANERLKGSLVENQTFEIVKYGGELDGMRVYAVDDATFSKGENVLLFLEEKLSDTIGSNFVVNAMSQGKFRIEKSHVTRASSVPLMTEKNGQLLHTQKDSGESKEVLINLINDYTSNR